MVLLTVDEENVLIHRSVLDRVAEIAERLECRSAVALGSPAAVFEEGAALARLRRDLDQIIALADAAWRTGRLLGDIAVAPGDQPERVLDTAEGRLWAHALRRLELHGTASPRRVTELREPPGTARRAPLSNLIEPLAQAAARARVLDRREREHPHSEDEGPPAAAADGTSLHPRECDFVPGAGTQGN
ncbi:hypothetical protein [Actinomadura rugatobispora]|uniref:DUF222 domain-containing protein n=1 Tax=Actinomadura rugatobispora TaxID=1994 RepID=A0ABW1A7V1_9ACTN|nr:hypothetical protein GCM10010200_017650 [Actinomadura rugatobispora]